MRIRLETDAFYLILQTIKNNAYEMIVSPVHFEEVAAIKDFQERYEVLALSRTYGHQTAHDFAKIQFRTEYLYTQGFGLADAAHTAFAEASSDVFLSCDDKLLKKCGKMALNIVTMNPVEFSITEDLQ